MKKPTESDLLRQCLELLRHRKVFSWRQNQGAIPLPDGGYRKFAGLKGVSDILAVLPPHGTLLALELKVGKNRCTPEQKAFLEAVESLGGVAAVVRDVKELDELLARVLEG